MPAPRKSEGAAGGAMQRIFAWPYRGDPRVPAVDGDPALAAHAALARPQHRGRRADHQRGVVRRRPAADPGAVLSDVFDGSVARQRGEERALRGVHGFGARPRVGRDPVRLPVLGARAANGDELEAALALVTLVVSLSVSHIRAEAEAVGVSLTEGFFQRLERFLALMVGLLIPGAMLPGPGGADRARRHHVGATQMVRGPGRAVLTGRSVARPVGFRRVGAPRGCRSKERRDRRWSTSALPGSPRSPKGRCGRTTCRRAGSRSRTWSIECSRSVTSARTGLLARGRGVRRSRDHDRVSLSRQRVRRRDGGAGRGSRGRPRAGLRRSPDGRRLGRAGGAGRG